MSPKEMAVEKDEDTASATTTEESEGSEGSTESSSSDTTTTSSSESSCSEESGIESEVENQPKSKNIVNKKAVVNVAGKRATGKGKRKRPKDPITICLTNCRYEVVRKVVRRFNLEEVAEDQGWNIYWTDFSISLERAMDLRTYQLINHFPGMNEICRKDLLARNLNRLRKSHPKEYDIYPKTWSLPADLGELQTYSQCRRNKTFICKPEMGCQGRGIFLIRSIKDLNPFGKIICQLYIARPFLIDDLKFDLRIYVLITSCDPLRVWIYNEGLARFATAKYKPPTNANTENSYMHLTNYAVNKFSRDYVVDDEIGTKRKLTAVYRWFERKQYNVPQLMESIDEVIIKTIISAHPSLKHNYRSCFPNYDGPSACFEILGFDILIDHKLKPYVLEVNHSPSFHTDSKLDLEIKEGLVSDTIGMLNLKRLDRYKIERDERRRIQNRLLKASAKQKGDPSDSNKGCQSQCDKQFAFEVANSGGFRLVFPKQNSDKYDHFFEQNQASIYQDTAASQARAQCARNQIQEYNQKKQEENKRLCRPKEPVARKDKVRPESPLDATNSSTKLIKRHVPKPLPIICNSFQPGNIDNAEEMVRTQELLQRASMIRSLGIELQIFQLLSQAGSIKPEEERVFRRMHGFTNFSTPKPPGISQRTHSAYGEVSLRQFAAIEPTTDPERAVELACVNQAGEGERIGLNVNGFQQLSKSNFNNDVYQLRTRTAGGEFLGQFGSSQMKASGDSLDRNSTQLATNRSRPAYGGGSYLSKPVVNKQDVQTQPRSIWSGEFQSHFGNPGFQNTRNRPEGEQNWNANMITPRDKVTTYNQPTATLPTQSMKPVILTKNYQRPPTAAYNAYTQFFKL